MRVAASMQCLVARPPVRFLDLDRFEGAELHVRRPGDEAPATASEHKDAGCGCKARSSKIGQFPVNPRSRRVRSSPPRAPSMPTSDFPLSPRLRTAQQAAGPRAAVFTIGTDFDAFDERMPVAARTLQNAAAASRKIVGDIRFVDRQRGKID